MNRLILRSLVTGLLLLALLSVPSIASADSILWTLTGVTFSDGTTASGSFDYDSVSNTFSGIGITTSVTTYTTLSGAFPGSSSNIGLFLGVPSGDLTGPLLVLFFDNPLINTGGTVTDPLTTGSEFGGGEGTCNNADCSGSTENRFVTGGDATSTVAVVTPEPSALSLLGVALAALLAGVAIRKASEA